MGQLGLAAPESSAGQLFLTAGLRADGAAPSQDTVCYHLGNGRGAWGPRKQVSCLMPCPCYRAVISATSCRRKQVRWHSPEPKGWRCAYPRWGRGKGVVCSPSWLTTSVLTFAEPCSPARLAAWCGEGNIALDSHLGSSPFQHCKASAVLSSVKRTVHLYSQWSSGCTVAEYPRLSSLSNRPFFFFFFFAILETRSPRSRCWHDWFLRRLSPGLREGPLLHDTHMVIPLWVSVS